MSKIYVADHDFPDVEIERNVLDGFEVDRIQAPSSEDIIEGAADARGLLVQYVPITAEVIEALDDLEVIARYGIGVDNVDVDAATENGVSVVNVRKYCLDEVPEHALALLFACRRKTSLYDAAIADGQWDWKMGQPIHRIRGQTLGVAGFGDIPRHLVEKVEGLGVDLVGYDPYIDAETFAEYGVEKVDFEGLLESSDIISVHIPLTDETEGLFDASAFDRMKDTATIINTARGGVIDVDDLRDALANDEVGAAGLDVMPNEPPERQDLLSRDDVVASPHVAWYSEESMTTLRRRAAEQVRTVLTGGVPEFLVNEDVRGSD